MKHLIYTILILSLISCSNKNVKNITIKNNTQTKKSCNLLNIPDSLLNTFTIGDVINPHLQEQIELNREQVNLLSSFSFINNQVNIHFYGTFKVDSNIFVYFIKVVDICQDTFYMITTDCSSENIDFIALVDIDYFDIIDQNKDKEKGLFIYKYFKIINDTTISSYSITKEETKSIENGEIIKTQIDSLTYQYNLNRKGNIKLLKKDSVRIMY